MLQCNEGNSKKKSLGTGGHGEKAAVSWKRGARETQQP